MILLRAAMAAGWSHGLQGGQHKGSAAAVGKERRRLGGPSRAACPPPGERDLMQRGDQTRCGAPKRPTCAIHTIAQSQCEPQAVAAAGGC